MRRIMFDIIAIVLLSGAVLLVLLTFGSRIFGPEVFAEDTLSLEPATLDQSVSAIATMEMETITIHYHLDQAEITGTIDNKQRTITVKLDKTMQAVCNDLRKWFKRRYF